MLMDGIFRNYPKPMPVLQPVLKRLGAGKRKSRRSRKSVKNRAVSLGMYSQLVPIPQHGTRIVPLNIF
jgi:hypothetical protein